MARRYPQEFRDEVVAIARKGDGTQKQIAKDFGISTASLKNWLDAADKADGVGSAVLVDASLREANKRIRLLEQENEVLRRAAVYLGKDILPK